MKFGISLNDTIVVRRLRECAKKQRGIPINECKTLGSIPEGAMEVLNGME